nr:hypothetical protein DM860_016825 [Ipomoea trifida]
MDGNQYIICFKVFSLAMGRVPHLELGSPLFYRELVAGFALGLCAAFAWKNKHRDMQKKTKSIYQQLDTGDISVVAQDY